MLYSSIIIFALYCGTSHGSAVVLIITLRCTVTLTTYKLVWRIIRQAVCPIDSAAVKGITAQQVMYVRPGEWYRRPSMCFVVDLHVTTAVLIHLLGGHLLVDDTLAYYDGGTDTYISWANNTTCTASRMSYLCSTNKKYCKSMGILRGGTTVGEKWCPPTWRWATSRLCPPPTKHVLRGWYIVYGGTDTYAGRIPLGWRYTCLLGGHVTTTAVLIHQLGEHRPISGGTSCLDGDTLSWTIHICYTLVGWCYFLPGWAF